MKKQISTIAFILIMNSLHAQIMSDFPIEEDRISEWIVDDVSTYLGTYYFGLSEMESTCILKMADNTLLFTVKQNGSEFYGPDGSFAGWKTVIDTYTNVRIVNNMFYSDETNGKFVLYDDGEIMNRCLNLNIPPCDVYDGEYELGVYHETNTNSSVVGEYPLTSIEIISPSKLATMTLDQLKIMRNEIFARHGYIFIQGGEMDSYFRKKAWYKAKLESVDHLLSDVEKYNIQNILKIENAKK
ncbi:YARHG domain-containing protein [bacterium]|nr:YARHG domain-containing protein [bacterium]